MFFLLLWLSLANAETPAEQPSGPKDEPKQTEPAAPPVPQPPVPQPPLPPPPPPCVKASKDEIAEVMRGNEKKEKFLRLCAEKTNNSEWCNQLIVPNVESMEQFHCTYGEEVPHQLIHPDEHTWQFAFGAAKLADELIALKIKVCEIYNWWRPEPYNKNVDGSPRRHPFGTSVDVRFCSSEDMEAAFLQLCKWREEGRLEAIGYYGTTRLHFGMGDKKNNVWGKECPGKPPKEEKTKENKEEKKEEPKK